MKSISVKQKKRGRPATGTDPAVGLRFPPEHLDAVDRYAEAEGITRSEAIRTAVAEHLKAKGYLK
jgi:hypothetical protein